MSPTGALFNPFPGLRPFEPDEDHLFFGREKETDDLVRRLRMTRFVSVVGTSGSGKSSLVRSGLIPSLHSGFMARAGTSWRVAMFRPGEDPISHLAAALDAPGVLAVDDDLASTNAVLFDATLRRSTLGLVDLVRQAQIPRDDNLLVVVDQFEELFRFHRSRQFENSRDEAAAFVKLLLEATRQNEIPIYAVLTMRSDFIGDCTEFIGLPEAVNAGQYLVPRMTRDELRSAMTGPVAVGGATIAPRLVVRMLNDLGADQDQLPVLQHALMRTWEHWERRAQPGEPIDVVDYEEVGTLRNCLSMHAEEAYAESAAEAKQGIAEQIFKALTDSFSDQRGVRRPTSIAELAAICDIDQTEVIRVVEIFRARGRSFLMPPPGKPLSSRAIIDLSHESLMRCWSRLMAWAEEEQTAAAFYVRLSEAARWCEEGTAGLWRDPELELALRWRDENHPTPAWAKRYGESLDRAMDFLLRSERERQRVEAAVEKERKTKLRRAQWAAGVLGTLLIATASLAYVASRESSRAEINFQLARNAVDQTLAASDRDPARIGADVPQMEEFRRELLNRAERFYVALMQQKPSGEDIRRDLAFAHLRLGHISRMLAKVDNAAEEYRQAIAAFESLVALSPRTAEYREALADVQNWLGETLRPMSGRAADAGRAYDSALLRQQQLVRDSPRNAKYQEELARTLYNRGILRASSATPGDADFQRAESDFRESIRLLDSLAGKTTDSLPFQELARAYNNLASLLAQDDRRAAEVEPLFTRAIEIDERIVAADPTNRESKMELAQYCNNLAELLRTRKAFDAARQRSAQAIDLLEDLARPAPSLGIEQADAHGLLGRILQSAGSRGAEDEYRESLALFEKLANDPTVPRLQQFQLRFGDLLVNLAALSRETGDAEGPRQLLSRALGVYLALVNRVLPGSPAEAQDALDSLSHLVPELSPRDRAAVTALSDKVRQKARPGTSQRQ